MKHATVSVVMCTYNGEKFLREQLDSILAQTYPIHEIIIQDDCSTDGTMDILREYAAQYPSIKVSQNQPNKGCNKNFHDILCRAAQGETDFIAISDQDDIWFREKIEKQVRQITTGQYNLCFSDVISSTAYTERQLPDYKALPFTAESLLFRDNIAGHTMLLKKTFLRQLPEWDGMTFYYDWWLAMNAALEDSITKCEEPLSWHRVHAASEIAVTGRKLASRRSSNPLMPYIAGISHFLKTRDTESWKCFYENVRRRTSPQHHPILFRITSLFKAKTPGGIIRLCLTCMKYREQIYPHPHTRKGLVFALRGFFAPFLCTYYNMQFYGRK